MNGLFKKLRELLEKNIVYRVFIKKYRRYFIIGTISLIAVDIINIFPPLIIKETIDVLSKEVNITKIAVLSGLFLFVSLCQGVCRYLWRMNFIGRRLLLIKSRTLLTGVFTMFRNNFRGLARRCRKIRRVYVL